MEKYSCYYYEDAKCIAKTLQGANLRNISVDCAAYPCPNELESWSGEASAIAVEDVNGNIIAIVAYWVDYATELANSVALSDSWAVKYGCHKEVFEGEMNARERAADIIANGMMYPNGCKRVYSAEEVEVAWLGAVRPRRYCGE